MTQPCKQPLTGRLTGPKGLRLFLSVGSAVQRGHFVCMMSRAGLMALSTLGVVGGRIVLPGTSMHRRLLMMRCGCFAAFRCLCVLFLDVL